MKNPDQFFEFLRICKEQHVKYIHLLGLDLLVNPSSGDFGSIIIEFERCNYLITANHMHHQSENNEINEFAVKKLDQAYDLAQTDVYRTISAQEHSVKFITEMIDSNGYFDSMEWKYDDGYLFFTVCCPIIAVHADFDERLKYMLYSHQFGEDFTPSSDNDKYYELFPDK